MVGGARYFDGRWEESIRYRTFCKITRLDMTTELIPGKPALIGTCDQRAAIPDSTVYIASSIHDPNLVLALHSQYAATWG